MTRKLNVGSHDLPVSVRLSEFMKGGWAQTERTGLPPHAAALWTPARRAQVSASYPGIRLVIPAGVLKVRANDSDFRFRPHSAFAWLTGIPGGEAVPETALVLEPTNGGHDARLYLHPRSPRDSDEFFRDRRFGEFWVGRSPTVGEAHARYGLEIHHIDGLAALLSDGKQTLVVRSQDPRIDAEVPPSEDDAEFLAFLSAARLIKDEYELAELQAAVDATILGFEDAVKSFPAAIKETRGERVVEGAFYSRARLAGNDLGYDTIAASGAHACVLHWIRNDGEVNDGDLLLLDAGVEMESLYTSDVTRTLPVNGKFTEAQRKIYLLVYEAQQAAIATIKPGAKFRDFHRAAQEVIAKGLAEWGVLPISAEESLDPEVGLHRRWTLCSTGHMLGLDVHDCAQARADQYLDGVLEVGQVLTVEPGLYLQPDDLLLPEELRGIGIRIEDDVVVTEDGCRLLTEKLPRHPDEIERWMANLLGF
jgi:Xaa-Pro aminopeptidase